MVNGKFSQQTQQQQVRDSRTERKQQQYVSLINSPAYQRQQMYNSALNTIKGKISSLQQGIKDMNEERNRIAQSNQSSSRQNWERYDRLEEFIREAQQKLDVYQNALSQNPDAIVENYYSGNLQNTEQNIRNEFAGYAERAEQKLSYKQQIAKQTTDPSLTEQQRAEASDVLAMLNKGYSMSDIDRYVEKKNYDIGYAQQLYKFSEKKGGLSKLSSQQQTWLKEKGYVTVNPMGDIDTTLKLGGSEEKPKVMTAGSTTFTKEQQEFNDLYNKKTKVATGFDWVKNIFGGNKEATIPKIEFEKKTSGTQGSVITEIRSTPKSSVYPSVSAEETPKMEKYVGNIFFDYERKLRAMENPTQEKVNIIKKEKQDEFNKLNKQFQADFSKSYETKMRNIERGETIKNAGVVGAGWIAKQYFKAEDKDIKRKGTGYKLFGSQEETQSHKLKDFKKLKSMGMSSDISRELVGLEEFGKGATQSFFQTTYENPRTIGIKTVAFASAIAGATVLTAQSSGATAVATSPALKWAGYGLGALYGGSVVYRTAMPSTAYERGFALGEIGSKELLPMMAGGFIGVKAGAKVNEGLDWFKYKKSGKYPYRASYKLTEMQILEGDKNFPLLKRGQTQKQAFSDLNKNYLTPDERRMLKSGRKPQVTTHATAVRKAIDKELAEIGKTGREINALSVSNTRSSVNFLDVGKSSSYSLYGGSPVPVGSSPLIARINVKKYGKIPKGYKPLLSKAELSEILGAEINPKYFKLTSWLYERGDFGTAYKVGKFGLKSEIESYLKGGGSLAKTKQTPYFTQIASQNFYKNLEKINRLGYTEYVRRVPKFKITKPSSWIDKLFGKQAGQFKTTKVGRVVPMERFDALSTEMAGSNMMKEIKKLMNNKELKRSEMVNILKEKSTLKSPSSSRVSRKSYLTYSPEYAFYSSFPKRSSYKSPSYSASRSASLKSSISSRMSRATSSLFGSSSASSKSYARQSRSSSPSYSYNSIMKTTPYRTPALKISWGGKPRKRALKKRIIDQLGLFPDFTARAIGLKPKEFSMKDVDKAMRKLQTGFEVRTGGRIKGFKEKDLMKDMVVRM